MSKVGKDLLKSLEDALVYAKNSKKGIKTPGVREHIVKVPINIDVKAIREGLDMDRLTFAVNFGFSLRTLEKWEQGIRQPESPTRAYLKVIAFNPKMVKQALQA